MSIVLKTVQLIEDFRNDKLGVTAVEYGLIAALISVAIITAVALVGTNLTTEFDNIASKLV